MHAYIVGEHGEVLVLPEKNRSTNRNICLILAKSAEYYSNTNIFNSNKG